jgi:hypothetical protein
MSNFRKATESEIEHLRLCRSIRDLKLKNDRMTEALHKISKVPKTHRGISTVRWIVEETLK